jgi:hypothetical protein
MKPLYRQNSHYIGKSTTSRLTYRLVTKSVPCRLDSTYRLENLGGDLGLSVDRRGAWLAVTHASTLKDVPSILALVEEEVVGPLLY